MHTEDINFDVVIVGAGMVGLTLANLLIKQGKSVAIIDRKEPLKFNNSQEYDVRVTSVSPGSKAIFNFLGAWDLMQSRRISPYTSMYVWEDTTDAKISFNAFDLNEPNLGYIVENVVIQSSLYETIEKSELIHWKFSTSISSFELHENGIKLVLADNSSIWASLLVGADGFHSSVRKLADLGYIEKSYEQKGIVARVQTQKSHQNTAWQRFLKTGPIAILPLSNGECSIVWSAENSYAEELLQLSEKDFSSQLSIASDYQLGNVKLCSQRAAFPLVSGQAESMVQTRIALIGDAAHALHPLAGQGANIGFTDAAVLAETITSSDKNIGSYKVLRKYERARKGETQVMQFAMNAFVSAFSSTSSSIIATRNFALNSADKIKPVKIFFMRHAMGLNKDRPAFAR